jgi:hypothetical protein
MPENRRHELSSQYWDDLELLSPAVLDRTSSILSLARPAKAVFSGLPSEP